MEGQLTKNFNVNEFKCPCCGKVKVTQALVTMLQIIRDFIGKEIIIESGFRCISYNASLPHSAPNSGHLTGEAADIRVEGWSNKKLGEVIKSLYKAGKIPQLTFTYLITGKTSTSVHVGVDKKVRKNIFAY